MQIEAYNLDSLRKLVRGLQDENRRLKEQLDKAGMAYEPENVFEEKIEKKVRMKRARMKKNKDFCNRVNKG